MPSKSDKMLEEDIENFWKRGLYILLYIICFSITEGIATAVMFIQFIWVALNKKPNDKLCELSMNLAEYLKQLVLYVTWNNHEKPWPVNDWPKVKKK